MRYKFKNLVLSLGQPFVDPDTGTQYGPDWLRVSSDAEKAAINCVAIVEQTRPDEKWNFVTDNGDGTYTATQKTLEQCQTIKLAEVANKRWAQQSSGVYINNYSYSTDDGSKATYLGILLNAQSNAQYAVNWKTGNGTFVTLTANVIPTVVGLGTSYIQSCFDKEKALQAQIMACNTANDVIALDITGNWPNNQFTI